MNIGHDEPSNVIPLATSRAEMRFPAIARVETYWEALRDGRRMPARAEVDPRGIADVLEYAFILESVAPGVARMRIAGMHLNDLMGMDVRGMPVSAMFLPETRADLEGVLGAVLESPAKAHLTLGADNSTTLPRLSAQMLLLPLRDDRGRPTRILGALQSRGTIGRGPRRFRCLDEAIEPIRAVQDTTYPLPEDMPPAPVAAAEDQAPFVPHLKLVHDADD
jgi:hypothetical protein